jgi:Alr-MurF fusion protein
MNTMPLSEFADVIEGIVICRTSIASLTIEHVATHSGRIRSGAAFFALQGSTTDGHNYAEDAAKNGATAIVVKSGRLSDDMLLKLGVPVVVVPDPLLAIQMLAAWWRAKLSARFVAVVGSIGKTLTKDCLVELLAQRYSAYGNPGSYNSQLGVPLSILDCPSSATIAVIEAAASDPGEMERLRRIVRPDYVVVTNVGTRWRYRFANRQEQIGELLQIATELPSDGWVFLGQDDADLTVAVESIKCSRIFTRSSAELPRFDRESQASSPASRQVTFPNGETGNISARSPSEEIIGDVELAISAAWLLGVSHSEIVATMKDYILTSTRMEMWRSPSGVTLVRDMATPDPIAVSSAVRAAKRLTRRGGRTIVVLKQPTPPWDIEVAAGLATALNAEGVDEVYELATHQGSSAANLANEIGKVTPIRLFFSQEELRTQLIDHLKWGDVCFIQSSRGQLIDDLCSSFMEAMAPTRLYIDLSAMQENVMAFRRLVGPSVRIMAMVKALAYGTDGVAVSLGLHDSGVDFFGVSGVDEGLALRRAGVTRPILVMLGTEDEVYKMVRYRLTPLIYSLGMLDAVASVAENVATPIAIHLEVDTGMHRSGLDPTEAIESLRRLAGLRNIRVEGIMTHFSCADDPTKDEFTYEQLSRFEEVLSAGRDCGLSPIVHAAATAGTLRFPSARYDMVRIGLGLFGLHPSDATAHGITLSPVISLVSRIVQIINVPGGEQVGYGGSYTAPSEGGRVGVVPAGYHDCIPRAFSNFGYVIVAGARCPIVGKVSMDSMTVNLDACPNATVGSDVLIYGRHGDSEVPLEEVSHAIGTIPYEVMARVGPRVQRILTSH